MLALSLLFFLFLGHIELVNSFFCIFFSFVNFFVLFKKWLYKKTFVTQMRALCTSCNTQANTLIYYTTGHLGLAPPSLMALGKLLDEKIILAVTITVVGNRKHMFVLTRTRVRNQKQTH